MKENKKYHRRLVNALERNDEVKCQSTSNYRPTSINYRNNKRNNTHVFRNLAVGILTVILAVIWNQNWQPVKWWQDNLIYARNLLLTKSAPNDVEIHKINLKTPGVAVLPEIAIPERRNDASFTKYLKEMKNAGYSERYKLYELYAFYKNGIDINYLNQMNESGYLNKFRFPELVAFHQTGINAGYLNDLEHSGKLHHMSFIDIIRMHNENRHTG
ncbi:MAG TPA: hypothetical protein VJ991_07175 [Balneolales bacterium]|nr:hypothetical protein [Balneolales bacterium]